MDELLNTAPCGFLTFADDGAITAVNATLLDMLGYGRAELEGRHVETILTVGSRIFYQTHLFPLVRLHGRAEEIFLLLRSRSGEAIGVLTNVARREGGGAAAYDCVLLRVRERQRYEDELLRARRAAEEAGAVLQAQAGELESQRAVAEEANRAKSNFLAVMSHELRTPLNAIAGYLQLMEMGLYGPVTEAQREALGRVERSQRHLLRLINDVLNLARIEAGRVHYELEDVPVEEILAGVVPMVEPQLAAKGLAFEVRHAPGLVVRADRDKAQQVLLNLLGNAVKFTPAGGHVSVAAAPAASASGEVWVEVADDGIGIPAGKIASVFEPFVQVDVSRTRPSEGTGLGLTISRDLAEGMGGELRVRSVEGEGSTFTLALPRGGGTTPRTAPEAHPEYA